MEIMFLLFDGRIRIRTNKLQIRIKEDQKHADTILRIQIRNTGTQILMYSKFVTLD
jgi:hypothetical protein